MMGRFDFTKGMITGALVGAAVGMMLDPINDRNKRRVKRSAGRYMKIAGNVLESMLDYRR